MRRRLREVWAFLARDFLSEVSYRLAFVLQLGGILFAVLAFAFVSRMIDPGTPGLEDMPPFDFLLVGMAFQFYFTTALYSFSAKLRNEQLLGTLEAMLVSPTPTSMVIFSSAAWDFAYGAIRIGVYLLAGTLLFGARFHVDHLGVFVLGFLLTLLSSAGLGILSASFILYFKRGDPVNFLLSGATTFLGSVLFPVELLPDWIRWASDLLPITWSLRIIRGTLIRGQGLGDLAWDLGVLALMTAVLLPAGLICSRIAIRNAKREGTLVQY